MTRKEKLLTLGVAAMAGLAGGALSSSLILGGPAFADKEKVISAQQFAVVDGEGKTRGTFGVSGVAGSVALTLLSKGGEPRAVLGAGADGLTDLNLNHKGVLRAQIRIQADGTPNLELWDAKGKPVFQKP
jgi:hypothetical protein